MRVIIKLARKHPQGAMYFGRHNITYAEQELELNEAEVKDLENAGPKHWFIVRAADPKEVAPIKEEKKVIKKKVTRKKKTKKA